MSGTEFWTSHAGCHETNCLTAEMIAEALTDDPEAAVTVAEAMAGNDAFMQTLAKAMISQKPQNELGLGDTDKKIYMNFSKR